MELTLEEVADLPISTIGLILKNNNYTSQGYDNDLVVATILLNNKGLLKDSDIVRDRNFIQTSLLPNDKLIDITINTMSRIDYIRKAIGGRITENNITLPNRYQFDMSCFGNYIPTKVGIGWGAEGGVYQVCLRGDNTCNKYVMKVQIINPISRSQFDPLLLRNVSINNISVPLAPESISTSSIKTCKGVRNNVSKDFGITIMERWDSDLVGTKIKLSDANIESIIDKLKRLHNMGYIHGDVKRGNIVVKYSPDKMSIRDIAFIDFGLSRHLDDISNYNMYRGYWARKFPGWEQKPEEITRDNIMDTENYILRLVIQTYQNET